MMPAAAIPPVIPFGVRPVSASAPRALSPMVTIYLICITLPIFFHIGPLYLNTLRALLIVMVFPLALRLLLGHFGRLILTDALFLAYLLWTIPALAMNNPAEMVQQAGSTGAECAGGYLIGRAYVRTQDAFVALCRRITLIALMLLPFALIEARLADPVIPDLIRRIPGALSVPDINIPGRMGLHRVQNAFAHPIHYGLFCALAFSLCFIGLKNRIRLPWRWACSALIASGCLLALSSGALLALLLQLFLILWAFALRRLAWRWWLLLGLGVLGYIAVDLMSNRTPLRVFLSYATFSAHTAYWRALIFEYGLQSVWAHPLFGIGLNDWARPAWMYSDSIDNFWLATALRYGLPAAFCLIAGWLLVLWQVMRRRIDTDPALWQIRQAWVLCLMGLTFTLCTVHIWAHIYSFVFFLFAAGIWLIDAPQGHVGDMAAQGLTRAGLRALPLAYTRFPHDPKAGPAREGLAASPALTRQPYLNARPDNRRKQSP